MNGERSRQGNAGGTAKVREENLEKLGEERKGRCPIPEEGRGWPEKSQPGRMEKGMLIRTAT